MEHSKVSVQTVSADKMLQQWERYAGAIEIAMSESLYADDCLNTVMDALADWRAHLVDITVDGHTMAVAVIDTAQRKGGTWLNVWGVAGEDMQSWLPHFVDWLKAQALKMQFDGVMCGGRLGWEKELKRLGWKKQAVVMGVRVCH